LAEGNAMRSDGPHTCTADLEVSRRTIYRPDSLRIVAFVPMRSVRDFIRSGLPTHDAVVKAK
jgi:hypothetical protein